MSKDGFRALVLNLHTQAYPTAQDVAVRKAQIGQLKTAMGSLRSSYPDRVVFVMGDFNIIGGSAAEYWQTLIRLLGFGGIGGKDAYPNGPATYSKSNPLAVYIAQWASGQNYPFPPDHQRLDYIFCLPSLDGSVGVLPTNVEVLPFRSRNLTQDGLTTNEKSDHWSVRGQFRLVRK
jgi:hypothetical protein